MIPSDTIETQQKNLSSLLWWTRRVIAMRKNFKAFSRGSLEFLNPDNPKVLAFLRRFENETIVMVANSFAVRAVGRVDLSRFAGCVPMEVFSRNLFRPIRKTHYVITLGRTPITGSRCKRRSTRAARRRTYYPNHQGASSVGRPA